MQGFSVFKTLKIVRLAHISDSLVHTNQCHYLLHTVEHNLCASGSPNYIKLGSTRVHKQLPMRLGLTQGM